MALKLKNTLTGNKDEFTPIQKWAFLGKKTVKMYNCGPTVYDFAHIGNLRSYIFADTLRRVLEYNGYKVRQVINITDVGHLVSDGDVGEDKMTKALKREGKSLELESMKKLANFYIQKFKEDLEKLNIESPQFMPRASEHIKEQVDIIKKLLKKNIAYQTSSGIYFDVSKFKNYGKLGNIDLENQLAGARVVVNKEKRTPHDFALWKFNKNLGWKTPWGQGFPGWHIECSAMSMKYLGESFDIHTGGIEHIPIHHNNEIAQSESYTGKTLANYWLHNGHILVDGKKMAKSEGTGFTLSDVEKNKFTPLAYRYWILTTKYQTQANFTWEALGGAQQTLDKLYNFYKNIKKVGRVSQKYQKEFTSLINNDLDTPRAIALLWQLIKDGEVNESDKKATLLEFDKVFGLGLEGLENKKTKIPEEVLKLAKEREISRKNQDWGKADISRGKISNLGYEIKDTDKGFELNKKKN